MENNENKIAVYLYPEQRQVIENLAKTYEASFSWALRRIVQEWARVNPTETVIIGGEPAKEK